MKENMGLERAMEVCYKLRDKRQSDADWYGKMGIASGGDAFKAERDAEGLTVALNHLKTFIKHNDGLATELAHVLSMMTPEQLRKLDAAKSKEPVR